jgi:FkbM family methyltransferase
MKYSVIIPTYNHCDDLLKPCIESLLKFSKVQDIELIVSANGCNDNTKEYLEDLAEKYTYLGIPDNLKVVWSADPLGYSKACNVGIEQATCEYIVLLNNDVIFLGQEKNRWLDLFENQFITNPKCGISCVIRGPSEPAGRDFAVFFLVMIHRKVFDKIGLLNTDYGVGGGEDTEFSIEAENAGYEVCVASDLVWSQEKQMYTGVFPVYHKGEGTMHDPNLVPEWSDIFLDNSLKLAKKYNPEWYQWRLSNYWERAVIFKGDIVPDRETTRYKFAAENIVGKKVFELGCSSGYGIQFLPKDIEYMGLDYDRRVIQAAKEQDWGYNANFVHGDINTFELDQYDTIIAFEVVEHLENGLEIVEKLKKHCKRLLITVPMLEPVGKWGPHHKLHMLDETYFPGFRFKYITPDGKLQDEPHLRGDTEHINLMICFYDREDQGIEQINKLDISFLLQQNEEIYNEIVIDNVYKLKDSDFDKRTIVDIGANIGVFSLFAARNNAKKIIAIEPVTETFMRLCSNINNCGLVNVFPLKNIVSDKANNLEKISKDKNLGHNSLYRNSDNFEFVSTITLSQILNLCENDDILLKIDCEGAEYDILLNATDNEMQRISTIVLEIHGDLHPIYKGHEIIYEKLKSFGFKLEHSIQIYSWDINEYGERINYKPIPVKTEHWKNER